MSWAKNFARVLISILILTSIYVIIHGSDAEATEQAPVSTVASNADSDNVAAASGSNRFVVWDDFSPGNKEILFKRSSDNGATWQPTVNLSNNPGESVGPQIAVSGSNVYVVWLQLSSNGQLPNIFIRGSTDNGATWGSKIKVSTSDTIRWPFQLAASGSNVYVVWQDTTTGNLDIFFRRSTDNGATWKPIVNLSSNGVTSEGPQIAVSGSRVYVVWSNWITGAEMEILLRRSTDNGATWKSKVNISETPRRSIGAEIAVSGPNVYVAWEDATPGFGSGGHCSGGACDIFFRGSTDNGITWKPVENLSNTIEDSQTPRVVASGTNVHVVWSDDIIEGEKSGPIAADIFYRRSTDNAATWKPTVELVNNPGTSLDPQIAISGSNVYVVWDQANADEDNPLTDVFFLRSMDHGATWKLVKNLSSTGRSGDPDLATSGSGIYVVWTENPIEDEEEIIFQRSIDNGATWKPATNLSNNAGSSRNPQLSV